MMGDNGNNISTLRLGEVALPNLPLFQKGWVWLTGAGPGDPGMLTLHALNAMKQADVVVHDALVSEEILGLLPDTAKIEFAGKRGGKPSFKQVDISNRIIQLARQGKRVLRLKGGDPFVFGRGGEEALALVQAGIPFRVIPGISAGIGGLAQAGIPVTHRDVNQAVTFVTGHMSGGAVPTDLDWQAIAKGSPVIVLYMALKHIGEITGHLIAAGRSPEEPIAFVANASTPDQKVVETTLGAVHQHPEQFQDLKPAVIILGDAVRLRAGLDWLGAAEEGRELNPDPLGMLIAQAVG